MIERDTDASPKAVEERIILVTKLRDFCKSLGLNEADAVPVMSSFIGQTIAEFAIDKNDAALGVIHVWKMVKAHTDFFCDSARKRAGQRLN